MTQFLTQWCNCICLPIRYSLVQCTRMSRVKPIWGSNVQLSPSGMAWYGLVWLGMAWYGKVVWLASMAWSSAQTVIIFQPRCFLSFWSDLTKSWWWSWWSFDKYINRICTFFFKSNIGNLLPACVPSGWSNSKWHTAPSTRLLGRHTSWIGIASVLDISARRFWIKIFAKVWNVGVCRNPLCSQLWSHDAEDIKWCD